jgi:transcriptional regulator with XRE-family HTH domain
MTVGERIRQKRIELGLTQEELAKKAGYKSRSSINKIECSRDLPLSKVKKVAALLECSPSYIMGWQDDSSIIETANKDLALSNMSERIKDYALILNDMPSDQQEHIISLIDMLNKNNK